MDSVQEHHERRVGDQLMKWCQRHGTSFRFDGRAGEAPDLKYRDGKHWLRVEITSAYYDPKNDAIFKWSADAPKKWKGKNFDQYLVDDISSRIAAKCRNAYGRNCLLAVYVFAHMTYADEMEPRLKDITVPDTHCFDGIYLCGEFGVTVDSLFSGVGCDRRVWQVYPK